MAYGVALHLGERGLDLEEGASRRRGGVHGRVERPEADAAGFEVVDERDQLRSAPSETVEVEDDQDVALAQVVEAGGEFRPVGVRAGAVLLEDALAACSEESVELAVQDLPRLDGGNAGVADEAHGVPSLDHHEKGVGGGCYRRLKAAGLW